jgi:hypothetical protein
MNGFPSSRSCRSSRGVPHVNVPARVLNGIFWVLRSGGEPARRMANQCTRSIVITFDWDLLYCVRVSALGELSFNRTRG